MKTTSIMGYGIGIITGILTFRPVRGRGLLIMGLHSSASNRCLQSLSPIPSFTAYNLGPAPTHSQSTSGGQFKGSIQLHYYLSSC